ncbi:bifunctional homocysteine S-methyltransferase/methylenetetrahydrofolate reductase [Trebonia kvetii]|uniref:bifunctional homocysteine S-methyltransferase/methylenetetrahydrofolate reductase n=1 Tax=Trebonia kvetii TaxID=2480626 RepID=UPI001C9E761F|nr:bifunctional homocysteine S-methyltransferase/methylenetetrahydrofolate reductase [Trebonia kvetii]
MSVPPSAGAIPVAQLLSGERVLVCDGAMGTMLHAAGAALDRSLPELNLSDPSLVATIHDSYLSAGADIIQANTFGANRLWLADHGFPDKVAEINRAGVRLAREAADRSGRQVLVAASVSPAVTAPQRRRVGAAERMEVLREQILALIADNAADLIILETFGYLDELVEAVSVAAAVTSLPLIAQATFADDAHTLGGETPREVASVLSALPVAMIGTNCTVGPQRMLVVAEDLVRYSAVPVSAQPNAGQPRRTGPRSFEFAIDGGYFSRYLTRFADAGVTLVGGCCGTTPTHIRAAAEALRTQPAAQPRPQVAPRGVAARIAEPMAGGPASGSLADHLASGRFVVSAAITPPAAGWAGDAERAAAEFADRGIGLVFVQPRENARTHMDSLNMALALQQRVGVETIPTITTWDKSIMSLQADLLGAHALGVRSVVSTTGSPPVFGDYPAVDGTWEVDSVGLTALLAGLNAGRDSNGLALTARTSFCIGARVNPTARDHDAELARVRAKLRAGAQFLVCRPVYELDALIRLVEALDGTGVPLLLSVTPLASFEDADYLAHEVPGVAIPSATLDVMERAGRSGGRAAGIDLAASLLAKARPLVSGVILTAPGDDPAALAPLIDALG